MTDLVSPSAVAYLQRVSQWTLDGKGLPRYPHSLRIPYSCRVVVRCIQNLVSPEPVCFANGYIHSFIHSWMVSEG